MPRHNGTPPRLGDQVCFPLYAASRLVIRMYQPLLEPLGLTYPQYLAMLLLWEFRRLSVSEIGRRTFLESSTLTPLLRKLEEKGLVVRERSAEDERVVEVSLTAQGKALGARAAKIPEQLYECIGYPLAETLQLKTLLTGLIEQLTEAAARQQSDGAAAL